MIKSVIMDIEGTTTSIDFVHKTLFPYSARAMAGFIEQHRNNPEVAAYLKLCHDTMLKEGNPDINLPTTTQKLLEWIKLDRKHPGLKGLQGLIWKDGFEQQVYQSHLYDDVLPALQTWSQKGIDLRIYSSGSVQAQKLLFGHTSFGDITPLLSGFYDTAVGEKRSSDSYRNILKDVAIEANSVLFLSDMEPELDAAAQCGIKTIHVVRPGTTPSQRHLTVTSFSEVTPHLG